MADPLSITASVITVAALCTTSAKTLYNLIRDVRHIPEQLTQLSNEVNDLMAVLLEIESVCKGFEQNQSQTASSITFSTSLFDQLAKTKQKLEELNNLMETFIKPLPGNKLNFNARLWMRKKRIVKVMMDDVKSTKERLHVLLDTQTLSGSARIELALHQLESESLHRHTEIVEQLSAMSTEKHDDIIRRLDHTNKTMGENLLAMLLESKSLSLARKQTGSGIRPGSRELFKDAQSEKDPQHKMLALAKHPKHIVRGIENKGVIQLETASLIKFTMYRVSRCQGWCDCKCHARQWIRTPRFLKSIVGMLFIGYAGLPIPASRCDKSNCHSPTESSLKITYCFPQWFLNRAIYILLSQSRAGDPTFGLTIRRRIEYSSEESLFMMASSGNLQGIRALFNSRKAFPNDVTQQSGQTALHMAIINDQNHVAKFLIDAGADPLIENDMGVSALQEATARILSRKKDSRQLRELESIFPGAEQFESWEFTSIHRVILGFQGSDLQSLLEDPSFKAQVNVADSVGRTPLHWAAERGDSEAVKELILAGADVQARDHGLRTPLYRAALSSNPECIHLLLVAGSTANAMDSRGDTPLIEVCRRHDDVDFLLPLVLARANIDCENLRGGTPLQKCAIYNHVKAGIHLLKLGADINHPDIDGDTPLVESITNSSHEFLQMLLDRGANHRTLNKYNQNILHMVALKGDTESARILAKAQLPDLDVEAEDWLGRTPLAALQARQVTPDGLEEAFNALLESSADVYYDASES